MNRLIEKINKLNWGNLINSFIKEHLDYICEEFSTDKKEVVNKIRHFKPTIRESTWSKEILWEERAIPLTDKELKKKYKVEDKYLK